MWAPIYGAILNIEFFQPLAALVKSSDGLSFFASENGILFVSIVTIILTSALVALGMAGYARIQKWCLYLGLIGLGIMFVLMLMSSQADFKTAFDRANENLFGISGAYDKTLADAAVNDAWVTTLAPTDLGRATVGDTLLATLAMIPFMLFWILYPNWGSTLYGEVRGSGDFRKVLRGHARRHLGDRRSSPSRSSSSPRRRSAGTSSPRPTRTSSTTSTGTRRRRRRCRSGATRRSSPRT